jgi:hypothetical protein
MRIFALADIHTDCEINMNWLEQLSASSMREIVDVISHALRSEIAWRILPLDFPPCVNNAFSYPHETSIAAKKMLCIHST